MQKKKMLRHKFYPVLLISITGAFVIANYIQYMSYQKLNSNANQILNEIQKENERQKKFESQIKTYNSDEYIEKTAREKLGLVKSNEVIFYQDREEN